jgi:hypothetical protein
MLLGLGRFATITVPDAAVDFYGKQQELHLHGCDPERDHSYGYISIHDQRRIGLKCSENQSARKLSDGHSGSLCQCLLKTTIK